VDSDHILHFYYLLHSTFISVSHVLIWFVWCNSWTTYALYWVRFYLVDVVQTAAIISFTCYVKLVTVTCGWRTQHIFIQGLFYVASCITSHLVQFTWWWVGQHCHYFSFFWVPVHTFEFSPMQLMNIGLCTPHLKKVQEIIVVGSVSFQKVV
jgi:hypothetical protein